MSAEASEIVELEHVWTRARALVMGGIIGAIGAMCAFRSDFVAGTAAYWDNPRGDVKMQLTGYLHYVREPWTWPLGVSRTINAPEGYDVAFADTTPLLALVGKLLRPLVPHALEPMLLHPWGAWLVVVWVLQGVLSARLAWELGVRTRTSVACAAALACTLPAFVMRAGHTSLDAHFLLTWGLLLVVVARREPPSWARALHWAALMGLAALIHPYLLVMCSALLVAWTGTSLVAHRRERARALAASAGGFASALVALAVFGELAEGLHWAPLFGESSFNPAMLVLTRFAALNPLGRLVDPDKADATGFQYEGYDYLGLGVLALLVAVVASRRAGLGGAVRRHAVLAIALVLLVVFAFSNRCYVGQHLVFAFDVPEKLRTLVSQFRSSGRFVWAPTYALLFFLIARTARMGKQGARLLVAATLVQVVDVVPHFGWVRDLFGTPDEIVIDRDLWSRTLERHDEVRSYPSFECAWMLRGAWEDPNYKALYQLALRSAVLGKTVNSIHNARPGRDCLDDVRERETLEPRPGTLDVFMRRAATGQMLTALANKGARCVPFDRGYACSTAFGDDEVRAFEASAASARYTLGSWITFGGDGAASERYEGGAWGPRTAEGAYVGWPIEGSRSTIHFVLDRPRVRARTVELEVDAEPGALAPTDVAVEAEGVLLGIVQLAPGERATLSYRVRGRPEGRDSWLALDLFETPQSPGSAPRARLRVRRARLDEHVCHKKKGGLAQQDDVE